MKIFLSYSSQDRAIVKPVADDLEQLGHDIWFDQELTGGTNWWNGILNAIRSCDCFIFCLTPRSLNSEPCQNEYTYGQALGKPILPIILGRVDLDGLPTALSKIQYVDYTKRDRDSILLLNKALRSLPAALPLPDPLPPPPAAPLSSMYQLMEQAEAPTMTYEQQAVFLLTVEDMIKSGTSKARVSRALERFLERPDLATPTRRKAAQLFNQLGGTSRSREAVSGAGRRGRLIIVFGVVSAVIVGIVVGLIATRQSTQPTTVAALPTVTETATRTPLATFTIARTQTPISTSTEPTQSRVIAETPDTARTLVADAQAAETLAAQQKTQTASAIRKTQTAIALQNNANTAAALQPRPIDWNSLTLYTNPNKESYSGRGSVLSLTTRGGISRYGDYPRWDYAVEGTNFELTVTVKSPNPAQNDGAVVVGLSLQNSTEIVTVNLAHYGGRTQPQGSQVSFGGAAKTIFGGATDVNNSYYMDQKGCSGNTVELKLTKRGSVVSAQCRGPGGTWLDVTNNRIGTNPPAWGNSNLTASLFVYAADTATAYGEFVNFSIRRF